MSSSYRLSFVFILMAVYLPQEQSSAQSRPKQRADPSVDVLLSRYRKFVHSISPSRFNYTMTGRRATGDRAVLMSETGYVKVDIEKRLFHRSSVLKASVDGGTSFMDQGSSEHLLNGSSRFEVDSSADKDSVNDPAQYSVNVNEKPDELELAKVFIRLPLSALWGYFPIIEDHRSIVERGKTRKAINSDAKEDSGRTGFSLEDETVIVKIWFDWENPEVPKRIEWTRKDAQQVPHGAQVGGVLEVTEVTQLGSKGIPTQVTVTLTEAGGTFSKRDLAENARIPEQLGSEGKITVPSTQISLDYAIEKFEELNPSGAEQFVLSRPIPTGAHVTVVGKEARSDLYWKDGNVWRLPPDIDKELDAARFLAPNGVSWKMPLLILVNAILLSCILAIRYWRKRKA